MNDQGNGKNHVGSRHDINIKTVYRNPLNTQYAKAPKAPNTQYAKAHKASK